jgi:DUF2934 family protein
MDGSQTSGTQADVVTEHVVVVVATPVRAAGTPMSAEELQQTIAVAAYYRAERRGFEPGHDWEDWLDAEAEAKAQLEGLKGFPA